VSKSGGSAVQFCVHNTAVTTCEAVVSLTTLKSCSAATLENDCGRGARCEQLGELANRCTYACVDNADCPSNKACNNRNTQSAHYCGGPQP
jgi:hypothetical protein